MKVHVDSKDDIKELKGDSRGRVSLGPEYAEKEVQLAILDTNENNDSTDE